MIQTISDFSEIPTDRLPFAVLRPYLLEFRELSVRIDDVKWPTVRFKVISANKEYRVKEFFMDWFFTGFPKSIMKDFSSSYSEVQNFTASGTVFYYGRNYKGHDSVSSYHRGTQIEIECSSAASPDEFKVIASDLLSNEPDFSFLRNMQFPDRSHHSKEYQSEWFENRRINRLNWLRTGHEEYSLSGHMMSTSGIGNIHAGKKRQLVLVMEEGGYRRNIWTEITSRGIPLENATYNMRPGTGFYTEFKELPQGSVLYREPTGPGVLRFEDEENTITVGFSPGFALTEINDFSDGIDALQSFTEDVLSSALQDIA